MLKSTHSLTTLFTTTLVLFTLLSTGCGEDPVGPGPEPQVTAVQLDTGFAELAIGDEYQLEVEISTSGKIDESVRFITSSAAASVDANGLVSAKLEGQAIITAISVADPTKRDTATFQIKSSAAEPRILGVNLDYQSLNLIEGDQVELKATVNATGNIDKSVSFSSSNPNVATVDGNGMVTAMGAGQATITAQAKADPSMRAMASVNVTLRASIKSVSLDHTSIRPYENEALQLTATVDATGNIDKRVQFASSNGSIASVDANGLVRAVKQGTATVTVTSLADPSKKATCKVEVFSTAPGAGYVRLQNRWHSGKYVHIENGPVELGALVPGGMWSAQWKIVPIPGTDYVRFENRFKAGKYLHIENGPVQTGSLIAGGMWSAQWKVIPVAGTNYVRFQNRWKTDKYLHTEYGKVEAGTIQPGWWSAMWTIDR